MKKMRPPTGIPKSMLVANPDGSYALPSGAVAILRPNEYALLIAEFYFFCISISKTEISALDRIVMCVNLMYVFSGLYFKRKLKVFLQVDQWLKFHQNSDVRYALVS